VEKPITTKLKDAESLVSIAKKRSLILQVGHVERFNKALAAIENIPGEIKFIECHRIGPFSRRSTDVSVVLDLMIHDLDIIFQFLPSKIKKIEAKGVKVLSAKEDIANCRISFKNGCVANVTSSRISSKKERKIRIFMPNKYISLDYANQSVNVYQKDQTHISHQTLGIEKEEPLKKEINHFINLVIKKDYDSSSAQGAKDALSAATTIEKIIKK